jgi:rhodanese-related sulfurtransferase/tetratricopeptide (TPR) repeat protein
VQQVAKDLGVRYVLEGSVRRAGDTLRINAQLVDALGGQHLWADRYDGSIKDVFALQDKVIGQIVAALAVKLTQDERSSVELIETQNPQAYDALLQGWAHYRRGTGEEETNKAIALFEKAVALDPDYGPRACRGGSGVLAHRRLVVGVGYAGRVRPRLRSHERPLAKARRQPNALADAISAEVLSRQGRYDEAFDEIARAMTLAPSDPNNYLSKARILNATGHAAEAEESVRWAMRLDPLYPPDYLSTLAASLYPPATLRGRARDTAHAVEPANGCRRRLRDAGRDAGPARTPRRRRGSDQDVQRPERQRRLQHAQRADVRRLVVVRRHLQLRSRVSQPLMEGLRKAGVPEGAGTDVPLEKYRALLQQARGRVRDCGHHPDRLSAAKSLHDRGVKFVDVRAAKDFTRGHIPGAFNLDVATELSCETLSRIVGKDEDFVMSCHGKYCTDSVYACAKAVSWGFKKVHYFAGGFPAWKEAGYPVEVSATN